MKQNISKPVLLIIPDVHGRLFWIPAVEKYPNIPVVFLGDYLDPYSFYEDIYPHEAYDNFLNILEFKKSNVDRVTLLLGNHDIHYFDSGMDCSRKNITNYEKIHKLYTDSFQQFKLAKNVVLGDKNYLFTHAGIILGWLKARMREVDVIDTQGICQALNDKMNDELDFVEFARHSLMDVSLLRCGSSKYPSPVWADVDDHGYFEDRLPNAYQIFGHTQQMYGPIITEDYACLDCRRAFVLTDAGQIMEA